MCLLWFPKPSFSITSYLLPEHTFCTDLESLYKHELPLIRSHWPGRRCPILHILARWPTSGMWIVPERVELMCHITLPEDASARSSHLCLLLRVDVPQLHWESVVPPGTNLLANLTKYYQMGRAGRCWSSVWTQPIIDTPGRKDVNAVVNPAI